MKQVHIVLDVGNVLSSPVTFISHCVAATEVDPYRTHTLR
jgi:hypothetical protein